MCYIKSFLEVSIIGVTFERKEHNICFIKTLIYTYKIIKNRM